ncbi:hypothetical protein VCRA2122O265_240016 [Vibrio crassostreae]|nr:hypothetical protein VCRA2113O213_270007 [Vibrio crassostreae]CAK2022469.1 hypothetical protein VCRA2113O196_320027 [Vibrio crassostreae]CAK2023292.1 hypothetical protein VCRA2113O221_320028 [Vibrio crassostreae]CAK2053811.1 hypothetical protein VCRA2116O234_370021 [Vibrio crassostreae]CAK2372200.1 hypothetical protein VCRA2113O216_490018 [Vibrio crassostreae]
MLFSNYTDMLYGALTYADDLNRVDVIHIGQGGYKPPPLM